MTSNIAGVFITLLEVTSSLAENLAQSDPLLRYKAAEQRLHADPQAIETIQDHLMTQELAVAFLREVNQEISQQLGVDFASLARRSSGCC